MPSARVEHEGDVAVVTLARPPANAMDAASLNEVADVFDHLADDAGVTAIVLTGEGRSFSAGLDLKAIQQSGPGHQEALIEALNRAFLAVYSCPRLVVGAVNGHAIAGGLVLALCCDVRLVADVALKVGLAEVRVGVPYPVGAIEATHAALGGCDPLPRPWLTDETFAAAAAALRKP